MYQLIESGSIREAGLQQTDTFSRSRRFRALGAFDHWQEYLMEAGEVGLYTFFACAFTTLLRVDDHSPVRNQQQKTRAICSILCWCTERDIHFVRNTAIRGGV